MSDQEPLIDAKIIIQQLSRELKNVQQLFKAAGIARSSFYEIKKAYEQFEREGLRPKPKRCPLMPNETPPEIAEKILDMTRRHPSYSYNRIANELQLEGVGKVYAQSVVDCSCSYGLARLCLFKQPIHAVALVHEKILPSFLR